MFVFYCMIFIWHFYWKLKEKGGAFLKKRRDEYKRGSTPEVSSDVYIYAFLESNNRVNKIAYSISSEKNTWRMGITYVVDKIRRSFAPGTLGISVNICHYELIKIHHTITSLWSSTLSICSLNWIHRDPT